jgi:hypothetical protein
MIAADGGYGVCVDAMEACRGGSFNIERYVRKWIEWSLLTVESGARLVRDYSVPGTRLLLGERRLLW